MMPSRREKGGGQKREERERKDPSVQRLCFEACLLLLQAKQLPDPGLRTEAMFLNPEMKDEISKVG